MSGVFYLQFFVLGADFLHYPTQQLNNKPFPHYYIRAICQ